MIYKSSNLEGLQKVINKTKSKVFSLETQYKFLKILKIIEPEIEIYKEQMDLLVYQFAERDANNKIISDINGIKIDPNKVTECQEKIQKLNSMEISFHDILFRLEEFVGLDLTLEDLSYFEPFIKH